MKRFPPVSILLALAGSAPLADAGTAPQTTTQTRTLSGFTRIDLRSPLRTDVHEGRTAKVSVQIDDTLQPDLVTRVVGDTLIVELRTQGSVRISPLASVSIDVPTLRGIAIEGPGATYVEGAGAHPSVDLDLSGPGTLHWSGVADVLRCRMEGPGEAFLAGSAKRMEATVSGPGTLDAQAFPVASGSFELSGPGSVMVDLRGGDVDVGVSGPGSFLYTGDAHFTRRETTGLGSIRKR